MTITDYYVTTDAMGSVTAILDDEGNVLERRSYDAFGEMTCMTPDGTPVEESPTGVDVGFQGQISDETTGLYQMGFRWFNPEIGRWLSTDPLGLAGGINLLCFANNSTTNAADPLGLDALTTAARAAASTASTAVEEAHPGISSITTISIIAQIAAIEHTTPWKINKKIEECEKIYKEKEALRKCETCDERTPKEVACKNMDCLVKELTLRQRYLDLNCDNYLDGSIKKGSKKAEFGHITEVKQKTAALVKCNDICCERKK